MRGYRHVAFAALGLVLSLFLVFGFTLNSLAFDGEEARLIGLINQYRQQNGLAPLAESAGLDGAALQQSQDMAASCSTYHGNYSTAGAAAENVAWGQTSAEEVLATWMGSAIHNGNMLNPNYTSIGTGHTVGECGTHWTAMFA